MMRTLGLLTAFALACTAALAQGSQADDSSRYKLAVYLWAADIDGQTWSDRSVQISFSELSENLDLAFMGSFEARISKWSVMADVVYMDVSADDAGTVSPLGIPVSADVGMTGWVVNVNAARNVVDGDRGRVNVLFGPRYFDLDNSLTATIANQSSEFGTNDTVWDGVVGVRGDVRLPKQWFLGYYLDIGTGDSDFTWQGFAGGGYGWKSVDVAIGYRYLSWEFDADSNFEDLAFSGPILGAAFKF